MNNGFYNFLGKFRLKKSFEISFFVIIYFILIFSYILNLSFLIDKFHYFLFKLNHILICIWIALFSFQSQLILRSFFSFFFSLLGLIKILNLIHKTYTIDFLVISLSILITLFFRFRFLSSLF